ncbi:pilus assembly protein [Pseudomonas fluorescens]|uniref:Type IV pilus biogenesis factor PilY1 n=1 Tax=Pseudomonas fluorescens TaxID=294 RepID=A0A5E7AKR6_PSEFL|nr:PilC/PilY family type IV pilus protein [Pseudomonas fluorescens]VVN79998.1 Type IV pilus biogenesis factor PilY1 [Pseudomonas fluorescens]
MRSDQARAGWQHGLLQLFCGALSTLYLAAPAYAFTPSDSPLLSAAAVAPNVMLLIDDSGSMNNIIWATGFNPAIILPQIAICSSNSSCNRGENLTMKDANISLSSLNRGECSSDSTNGRWYGFYRGSRLDPVCLKLPDPVGGEKTRYTANYLAYLLERASGSNKDFTKGTDAIPTDYRMKVARNVSSALVASNRSLRIGLATFNPPANNNPGPGGYIALPITDLSVVGSTVSQAQANANFKALTDAIGELDAVANTPLAETYYEITRYFRGMTPFYNSKSSTYTSPIQYRCQKNYGVVITDGLPTFDRTFPNNDPLGGNKLPNWDPRVSDGANLSGDGEGDTLYLDDIAKFAFDIDMRTIGSDLVGKSWELPDFLKQNMNTYTLGFTAANQMLSDAASYGQGKYYQASNSAGLSSALSSALSEITSKAGSGGSGATNGTTLTAGSRFFQTSYDPKDWRGTIKAHGFDSRGLVDNASVLWTTDTAIVPTAPAPIYQSWHPTKKVIPLAYNNFSTAQQTALSQGLPTGITGIDLVEWSKGTNKAGLKVRSVLLGDIINSPLLYVGPTDKTASDQVGSTTYSKYLVTKAKSMSASLVVNANDGFLSVIDPGNGARRYAYMPSSVLASLHYIADPGYINGTGHKFLNDGQVGVFDAQLDSAWKTLAVGGVGAGGKTFYAVQLFDESETNVTKALWEISAPATANINDPFNDLGYAYARPEVARWKDGRWAAFIANGYGSYSGVAALYVVDIRDGSLIQEIIIDQAETSNGLSSVKLKVDAQNVVQAAYGGDLKGRLWKFDLSNPSTTLKPVFSGKLLFTTPGGATQPITAQPLLADHPTNGKMVFFGTGKFNEIADKLTRDPQGFYAIWDADGGAGQFTVSNLQAQTVTGVFSGSTGQFITTSQNEVTYPAHKGWYLPLVYNNVLTGERVINQAALVAERIVFTSASVDTTDPCSSFGTGKLIELDAFSGKMLSYAVLDTNNNGEIDRADRQSSGVIFSGGIPTLVAAVNNATRKYANDSSGAITSMIEKQGVPDDPPPGVGNGRIMWRQIQ